MRYLLFVMAAALAGGITGAGPASIRGKLIQSEGKAPSIRTADGSLITLSGDEATLGVLHDKRLAGADLEARGNSAKPGHLTVDPIHTKALHVHKAGKRLAITYWCDVCAIRTYTPGVCLCCQENTELDLRDPDHEHK